MKFYLLPLKASSHCTHRCRQTSTDMFVRFCLISVLPPVGICWHWSALVFNNWTCWICVCWVLNVWEVTYCTFSAMICVCWHSVWIGLLFYCSCFTLLCCLFEVYKSCDSEDQLKLLSYSKTSRLSTDLNKTVEIQDFYFTPKSQRLPQANRKHHTFNTTGVTQNIKLKFCLESDKLHHC